MFEKDGKVYNLGVVDDKRMSDPTPSNIPELTPWDKFMLWVKKIMSKLFGWDVNSIPNWGAVVFLLVVLCVLGLIVKILWPFFPLIGHGIAALFKGLFWIISAPVRLIASLFKRKSDDR